MSPLSIAPVQLLRGRGAMARAAAPLARLGPRLLVVRGALGMDRLGWDLEGALRAQGVTSSVVRHEGPCSDSAAEKLMAELRRFGADAILGVGGGKVLDTAKAAADDAGVPFAALPTSPATCAAVTAIAVTYDDDGTFVWTRPVARPPELVVLDPDLLAAAPDRLLAAGILDAVAKVHEVRHTLGAAGAASVTGRAALVSCDDLETLLEEHADEALGRHGGEVRTLVAEACVVYPGLIGGLAGEEAKIALAHPLYNALTALPGSRVSLHGELVAFGVLVQIVLSGGDEARVRREAARYARLGLACHLAPLGCGDVLAAWGPELATRTVAMEPVRRFFPHVDAPALLDAVLQVDTWARDEAARAAATRDDPGTGP